MIQSFDQDIGMLTHMVAKKLSSYLNEKLDQYNLTSEQWTVLINLSKHNKVSQKQLAELSGKDQSTLVRILDLLEAKSFIKREKSTKDRRSFIINLSSEGLETIDKVSPFIEETFNHLLMNIPKEKLTIYNEVLVSIYQNIDKG